MDKALLVGPDVDTGRKILKTLEAANVKISVALWGFLSEYEDWRLILSSRQLDAAGIRDAYGLVYRTLKNAGFTIDDTDPIMILGMKEKFVRELRKLAGRAPEGRQLAGAMGDRYLMHSYVYRIT
jgi:hypothetical protein